MTDEPTREGDEDEGRPENGEGEDSDTSEERKPISVRDLMPPPSTRPQRREPESGRGGRGAPPRPHRQRGEAVGEEEDEDAEASQPTPVRAAMDSPAPATGASIEEAPSRTFEAEGEEWTVRVSGRTITGTRPDAGAVLMHLSFYRAPDLDAPRRELLTVDRPLDALYDEDLQDFLARSRPTGSREDEGSS